MPESFFRFTAPDPVALAAELEREQAELQRARDQADAVQVIDHAGTVASMLTTDRRESEARALLLPLLQTARDHSAKEPAGWLIMALATANQYLDLRAEANAQFAEALGLAERHGWRNLEHMVLQHWGRSLAEEHRFKQARSYFEQALAIRAELNHPRQESTRRTLAALAELENRANEEGDA